jgi:hypothetical protein
MKCRLVSFGEIEIDGQRFEHDVVIEKGKIRKRKKGPSKRHRGEYGHTPLTADEAIPWSSSRLIVGTGANGALPITEEFFREAKKRGVNVVALPTVEACELVGTADRKSVAAVLHVTC